MSQNHELRKNNMNIENNNISDRYFLKEVETFGNLVRNGWVNKVVYGDNLIALEEFYKDHEIKGKVKVIYIDPPFSTQRIFDGNDDLTKNDKKVYEDTLSGSEYLEFIEKRLVLLRDLLSDDGSIYVHIDQRMVHYVRVLMDEIFGKRNFKNMITRKKCNPKGSSKKGYGKIHDFILFYSKGNNKIWNRPYEKLTKEKIKSSEYIYVEDGTGRIYKKVPIHAPGIRNGATGQPWRGKMPPKGKHWQYKPERLDEFDKKGKIYWSSTGNPRLKLYLDESKGFLIQDIWLNFLDPMNQFTSVTNYPTEKNQAMIERIIKTSSNEGDLVLDCFAGSGTTLAAAEKLNRRWIGVDSSEIAIETIKKRLLGHYDKQINQLDIYRSKLYHVVQRF